MVLKKKAATGSMGYVVMFTMALLMVVLTLYMAQVARLCGDTKRFNRRSICRRTH